MGNGRENSKEEASKVRKKEGESEHVDVGSTAQQRRLMGGRATEGFSEGWEVHLIRRVQEHSRIQNEPTFILSSKNFYPRKGIVHT